MFSYSKRPYALRVHGFATIFYVRWHAIHAILKVLNCTDGTVFSCLHFQIRSGFVKVFILLKVDVF